MGVLYFLPQSEALERPSATLRVAEWGSHLSVNHRGACSPVAERKIFVKDEYPSSKPAIQIGICHSFLVYDYPAFVKNQIKNISFNILVIIKRECYLVFFNFANDTTFTFKFYLCSY